MTWWHNETKLPDTSYFLRLKMYETELGKKRCEATNAFGTIQRTYVIKITGKIFLKIEQNLKRLKTKTCFLIQTSGIIDVTYFTLSLFM